MNDPSAAQRSATQGPSYKSFAASKNGAKSISMMFAPSAEAILSEASNAASARPSPKKIRPAFAGTAIRRTPGSAPGDPTGSAIAANAAKATSAVNANTDTH